MFIGDSIRSRGASEELQGVTMCRKRFQEAFRKNLEMFQGVTKVFENLP